MRPCKWVWWSPRISHGCKQSAKVTAKGNRALGFVKRNIRVASRTTKEKAYKALVQPTLEYTSTVWSPHQGELRYNIEMIQRRAARFVMARYDQRDSVTEMLEELSWDTLEQRRLKARIIMGYRITHKLVMIPSEKLKPSKDTNRGHDMKYIQIGTNRNYYKHSFFLKWFPYGTAFLRQQYQLQALRTSETSYLLSTSNLPISSLLYWYFNPLLSCLSVHFVSPPLFFFFIFINILNTFTNTWPCASYNGLKWPPLYPKKILTNHRTASTVTQLVTTKHMAWDMCFVSAQNTNQKIYFFVLSMNYRSNWCAINICDHENILPA